MGWYAESSNVSRQAVLNLGNLKLMCITATVNGSTVECKVIFGQHCHGVMLTGMWDKTSCQVKENGLSVGWACKKFSKTRKHISN